MIPTTTTSSANILAKDNKKRNESSIIFQDYDRAPLTKSSTTNINIGKIRNEKAYQNSNIFNTPSKSFDLNNKSMIDMSNQPKSCRNNPTFMKTDITNHIYNEELENKKIEWKLLRKGKTLLTGEIPKGKDQLNQTMPVAIRKSIDLQSDIFYKNEASNKENISINENLVKKSPIKPTDFSDHKNEDKRKKDQMFSDIFDSDQLEKYNEKRVLEQKKKQFHLPSNVDWRDSKIEMMLKKKVKDRINPEQMKLQELSTSVIIDDNKISNLTEDNSKLNSTFCVGSTKIGKAKNGTLFKEDNSKANIRISTALPKPNKKVVEAQTLDFDLTNIPVHMDESHLKQLVKGYHLVELKSDIHSINGQTLGTGRLKVRSDNKEKTLELQKKLQSQGIRVADHVEPKKSYRKFTYTQSLSNCIKSKKSGKTLFFLGKKMIF